MTTDLIQHQKLTEIVSQYAKAQEEVAEAFRLLQSAKSRLGATFGSGRYYDHLWRDRISDFSLEHDAKESAEMIKRNVWNYIADLTQLRGFMSSKRALEFDKQIEKGELPEITEENILSTLASLAGRIGDLTRESIQEAFEALRPHNERYKTNKKWEIGPKVVLSMWVDSWGVNHYREKDCVSVDNAFHLLDGKGVAKYPDDLKTIINKAVRDKQSSSETEYFRLKWFKNCNLHLEFKRLDLLEKLNAIGGEGMLKAQENEDNAVAVNW